MTAVPRHWSAHSKTWFSYSRFLSKSSARREKCKYKWVDSSKTISHCWIIFSNYSFWTSLSCEHWTSRFNFSLYPGHGQWKIGIVYFSPMNWDLTSRIIQSWINVVKTRWKIFLRLLFQGTPIRCRISCVKWNNFWDLHGVNLHTKFDCPACSPDLNYIEHVWDEMGRCLHGHVPVLRDFCM